VLGKKSLSLVILTHELLLRANVVLVDIEEVVDGLRILLVELGSQSCEHSLQLSDIQIAVVVDVASSEQLLVRDVTLSQDFEKLEHGLVLERHVEF